MSGVPQRFSARLRVIARPPRSWEHTMRMPLAGSLDPWSGLRCTAALQTRRNITALYLVRRCRSFAFWQLVSKKRWPRGWHFERPCRDHPLRPRSPMPQCAPERFGGSYYLLATRRPPFFGATIIWDHMGPPTSPRSSRTYARLLLAGESTRQPRSALRVPFQPPR